MPKVIIPFSCRNCTDNQHEINMDGESLEEIMEDLVNKNPYSEWIKNNSINLDDIENSKEEISYKDSDLLEQQISYGYNQPNLQLHILHLLI